MTHEMSKFYNQPTKMVELLFVTTAIYTIIMGSILLSHLI
jgi:hypothetical protein